MMAMKIIFVGALIKCSARGILKSLRMNRLPERLTIHEQANGKHQNHGVV